MKSIFVYSINFNKLSTKFLRACSSAATNGKSADFDHPPTEIPNFKFGFWARNSCNAIKIPALGAPH